MNKLLLILSLMLSLCGTVTASGDHQPYQVGAFGMQGKRPSMEDTHTIAWHYDTISERHFFGVYDGHGGRKAAEFVAQNLHRNIAKTNHEHDMVQRIQDGTKQTEQDLLTLAKQERWNDGTCATFAILQNKKLYIGNIGDSRAVLCRQGKAIALSNDHKPSRPDERSRIELAGGTIINYHGVQRLVGPKGMIAVTRALGDAPYKTAGHLSAEPEISTTQLAATDQFLIIACDGVWDVLNDQQAVDIAREALISGQSAQETAKQVATQAYHQGSSDNISVLIITL